MQIFSCNKCLEYVSSKEGTGLISLPLATTLIQF